MTAYGTATLKTFFESGDVPQGSDYANLIDSYVNIVNTGPQSMAGALQSAELIASRVSAGNVNITGTLTVAGQTSFNGGFSLTTVSATSVVVSGAITATGAITGGGKLSGGSLNISGVTSAAAIYAQPGIISVPVTITASGTSLATANLMTTSRITLLITATDGSSTGIGLLSNNTGLQQYVYNDTAVSANLWPCTGGQINNLSSGAAFGMTAKTLYTIIHTKASGYAVK